MPGPSPNPDLMDPLGLFTQGEFTCFDTDDPELLLFTHGEFPRSSVVAPVAPPGTGNAGQGSGGKTWKRERDRWEKIFAEEQRKRLETVRRRNEEVIASALLLAEDEDEWDDWF